MQEDHRISYQFIHHPFEILKVFWYLFPSVNLVLLSKLLLYKLHCKADNIFLNSTVLTSDLLRTLVLHLHG